MEFKDYYQVMGVARDATEAQIKQAYRKLARKYHPDVSKEKDAEQHFKEVGEAYEVLKDPERRAAYDRLGKDHRAGEEFKTPPDWDSGFEFSGAGPGHSAYSDFFDSLFGAQARRARGDFHPGRGEDHHAKVLLDLEAALNGGARQLTLRMPEIDGDGRLTTKDRTLNVQVPKGILAGQQIRLAGQGERAAGTGAPGDLYIEVEFQPHPLYRLDGRDLSLELPVTPWEAALGATVKTPTPGGTVELKIPAGSHAGSKLRLKGRGIPASPPGDFYVELKIALPAANDEKSKAAYAAMAAALPFNPRASLGA
ncbi:MAG TPA: DnaJ C-terminal domain-containing protein [Steroidobacteraceae bacterium]|nr:DnaJ C-terminal domain-containing protein [Steroidobacteraceae bacterium]